ncbi:MAG: TonB-dependent receptor plug domain-containing protein [Spirochaetes bacterium]|nr:TonB-dependent receptor plug domain-containing protein [Spirochaetota bacterium]
MIRRTTISIMSFFLCLITVIALGVAGFGQEAADTVEPVNPSVKERKQSISTFHAGEIVVKEKALADIESAATTTEITAEQIRDRGDKTLDQALQMVPGVNTYQNAKGNMVFDIRGVRHGSLTMLVDGIPIEEVYNGGGGDVSRIPIMNASRITVSRGATSALYGTSATAGVINVVSKRPEALVAEASAEYGQYGNYTVNVAAGAPIGKAYFWVNASRINSDGYQISKRMNLRTRVQWFNKLVQYWAYGQTFESVTLRSKYSYLLDNGRWNDTGYTKYQVQGKFGYQISDRVEAGISAYYYHNEQEFNSFSPNSNSYYDDESFMWVTPGGSRFKTDSRKAALANYAWAWPEDHNFYIAPYFSGEFGDFSLRAHAFMCQQKNVLEPYATQDHTVMTFSSSTYDPTSISGSEYDSYSDRVQSIFLDTVYGVRVYPSYKFADWNKLTAGVIWKMERHNDYEKALDGTAINVITAHGKSEYLTRTMVAHYVTLALEDEMKFKTPAGPVAVTAGVSYDMQQMTKYQKRNSWALLPANLLVDWWIPHSTATLWGTRDSLNPVVGVVCDPIENFLRVRAAFSRKMEFPSMSVYATNDNALADINVKPEVSNNLNVGFELFFLDDAVTYRCDYFYSGYQDKIEKVLNPITGENVYYNIDGQTAHGLENTISADFKEVAKVMDVTASVSYVYLHLRNDDDSSLTEGVMAEKTPVHQVIAQVTMKFVSGTGCTIWGNHTMNQVQYIMRAIPQTATVEPYTTAYFTTRRLHDPWMLNLKVSQDIWEHFSVWGMCKNILDDYNADPLNPGAGRIFYVGGSGKL